MQPISKQDVFRVTGLLLLVTLSFSIFYWGMFDKAKIFLPTWDNAMLHAGRAVFIMETGHYAEKEVVFGGVTPTYHLPAYPALVAGTAMLAGLDFVWAERLIAMLFSVLLAFSIYLIAKAIANDWRAGVAAGIIAMASMNFMTWATRNSPLGLGNVLLPIALYFVLKRRLLLAALTALVLALDHQPSLLVFILTTFIYFAYEYFEVIEKEFSKGKIAIEKFFSAIIQPPVFTAAVAGIVAFFTYMAWHIRQTGMTCLDFKCLPQLGAKEFGKSINPLEYIQGNPQFIAISGILLLPFSKVPSKNKAMAFAWLIACLLLVKNDALGIGVFTERFLTYLDCAIAVFGGIGIALALQWAENSKTKEKEQA